MGKKVKYLNLAKRQEVIGILNGLEEKGLKPNWTAIARSYNVSGVTIRRISDKERYVQDRLDSKDFSYLKNRKGLSVKPFLEETLYIWLKQQRSAGVPISGFTIRKKAQIISGVIGYSKFKAGVAWLASFKYRYKIRTSAFRSLKGDKHLTDSMSDASAEFAEKLDRIMKAKNLRSNQIYNAEESGLLWKVLPLTDSIANYYETDPDWYKQSKERVTFITCANADGSHKIPLFVIGESNHPERVKNADVDELPVIYVKEMSAWMTGELFKKWYTEVFLTAVRKHQAEKNESYKVLLILDNAKCHLSKDELDSIDEICSVEFLPVNYSATIQPMNQGIIEKLKRLYRLNFLCDMHSLEDGEKLFGFLNQRDMETCCTQIADAWGKITDIDIRRSWKKIIPSVTSKVSNDTIALDDFLKILPSIPVLQRCASKQVYLWLENDANDPGWQILDALEIFYRIRKQKDKNLTTTVFTKKFNTTAKSSAERSREYRQRQKDATQSSTTGKNSNAERCRQYRQRQKYATQSSTTDKSSNAERCRQYRQRIKAAMETEIIYLKEHQEEEDEQEKQDYEKLDELPIKQEIDVIDPISLL